MNEENMRDGILITTTKGIGYVKNPEFTESIEIDPGFLNTGLHGDTVRVLLHPKMEGKQQTGEITEIIKRGKVGFSGTLEEDGGLFFLVPSDTKMYTDIVIPKEKLNGATAGQKVFAVISSWTDPKKSPVGEVKEVLGMPNENDAEMRGIALEKGFSAGFSDEVENEAARLKSIGITEEEKSNRRDFREILTFTIDPVDAKDFDDAISFRKVDGGKYEVGIHIADVSHYITPGGAIDQEAIKRTTSVYLVDRTIPMLPEVLSNDLCSLVPNEDRLTYAAVFIIDDQGTVHEEWFGRTIIHSDKRFTYEEAQKILDDKAGLYYEELATLNAVAKNLLQARYDAGAISLDQEEVKFLLDEKGVPIKVFKKERGDTNKLIEEFMLLANRKVAEYVAKTKGENALFIYRIHDKPDHDRMSDLWMFLQKLGFNLPIVDGAIPSNELNTLLAKLHAEKNENEATIQTSVVRSMAKAIYSIKNIGHYGLAFKHYTHFTSPIRRYPDVLVHRLMERYLHGQSVEASEYTEYNAIANHSSQREKEAAEAERASIKYKQVEYMSYRVGNVYDGRITGVAEYGIFVEELETKCEGLVRLKNIGGDFYTLNEKDMVIIGTKTGVKFKVGDIVKIRVEAADMVKKTIDYVFVK